MGKPADEDTIGKPAWHIHHSCYLFEFLTEPLSVRRDYIRMCKPPPEVETRLRLLKLVKGPLPPAVLAAQQVCVVARTVYLNMRRSTAVSEMEQWGVVGGEDLALVEYLDALGRHNDQLHALHELECPDCPWDDEQKTIFPTKGAPHE